MPKRILSVIQLIFLSCFLVAIVLWWLGFELPPALFAPGNYDSSSIAARITELKALLPQYDNDVNEYLRNQNNNPNLVYMKLDPKYYAKIDEIVGKDASPEDLAMLAIWAEREDPWLEHERLIYRLVNGTSVSRLAKAKDIRSRYALWKVRQALVQEGHFDGGLACGIVESEEEQNR